MSSIPFAYHDGHVHVFPVHWQQRIYQWFAKSGWELFYQNLWEEAIWQQLRRGGADHASILVYAHRPGVARDMNMWLFHWARHRPQLHLYGTVHPDDPDFSSIVVQALDEFQFAGFKIRANVQKVRPDDPRLDFLYQAIIDRNRSIAIHAGTQPDPNPYVGEDFLTLLDDYPHLFLDRAGVLTSI